MLKKIALIIGGILLLLTGSLFAIPYFFKDQIKAKIAQAINEAVDAKVSFAEADLSLFKNFPNATVSLEKFLIINKAPFAGDTLVSLGEMNLKMSIKELFKGANESMTIQGVTTKDGLINIIINKDGKGNFDIAKKDQTPDAETKESKPIALNLQQYKIENFQFRFTDQGSKLKAVIDSLNHEGTGDFAASKLDLNTKTSAKISMSMDKVHYMKNIGLTLDAILGIDLGNSKYSFKENKAMINHLPLEFDGFVQLVKGGQAYDLKFKTPTSSFKNFLGLIPDAYAASLEGVETTGDFTVDGFAKGTYTKTSVPKFNIAIASHNSSFQFPNLPKAIRNISIDTKIINQTGVLNDTYVNLDKLSFQIDQDVFNASAHIKNLTVNALVDAALKGTINLGNLSKAYPIKLDKPLTGILKANVTTKFDMESVTKSDYHSIYNAGVLELSGFKYVDEKGKAMAISKAILQFNPSQVNLKQFNATTGKSDIGISGVLDNFYGFMFKNQELKGNFAMISNQLAVNDFMTTDEPAKANSETSTSTEKTSAKKVANQGMKIPSFLNCTLNAKANTVLYDNLTLKDVSGNLIIKDQKATLEHVKTSIFGGIIGFNGSVSTKAITPSFDMSLNLKHLDITQSFSKLEMLKKIMPMAGIVTGNLNSDIQLKGNLTDQMTPNLATITGNLLGNLSETKINSSHSTLLSALTTNIPFLDLSKINLDGIKAAVAFSDGKVNIKPFDLKFLNTTATVDGSHGFDQNMHYNLKFDVPAKHLGEQANALLAKLSPADASKIQNIPIHAVMSGNFAKPKITTDLKSAVTNLTTQLIQQQKAKLISKGTTALEDLINKNKKPGDTTKTVIPATKEEIKEKAKEEVKTSATKLLKGLFNK